MKTLYYILIAIVLIMANSTMAQTNLVVNGGFEQAVWIDGTQAQEWSFVAGGGETSGYTSSTMNGVVPPEGSKMAYLKCLLPTTYVYQSVFKPTSGVGVTLKSGTKYTLTYKAYSVAGTTGLVPKIALGLYSVAPNYHMYLDGTAYVNVPSGSWQTFTYSFTATSAAVAGTALNLVLGVFVKGNEANTIFYFDDFSIVENNVSVSSIAVSGGDITTNATTSTFTASVLPTNAAEQGITWSVNDTTIATINANGVLTPLKNGTVVVTAKSNEIGSTVSGMKTVNISNQLVNLVLNGDFEQACWIDGTHAQEWNTVFSGNEVQGWAVSTTNGIVPPSGNKMFYLKCLLPTTYVYASISKPISGNGITLKSGSKYNLSFKAYSIAGTTGKVPQMAIQAQLQAPYFNTYVKNTYFSVPSGSWQTFSYSFTATSSAAVGSNIGLVLGVLLAGNEANTIFYVDDFVITENSSTAVSSIVDSQDVLLTNPVDKVCKIINAEGQFKSAQVYNLAGSLVLNSKIEMNNEIDFSSLAAGYYMLKLNGDLQKTFKVLKK
jgi:Secretion system C-terminal sorting domain/Bacterial Ig-like domain (group 2)/Carbohydrate binding domain